VPLGSTFIKTESTNSGGIVTAINSIERKKERKKERKLT
jgi:hypothetical protein